MSGPFGQQNRDIIARSLYIRGKNILTPEGELNVNSVTTKSLAMTGPTLEFTKTVGPNFCPCVLQNWTASANIAPYRVLKVGGTDFTVEEIESGDADETGVVGVSTTSALTGEIVKVCTSGIFSIQMEANASVSAGDTLKHSTNEDGKVEVAGSSIGTFGIALGSAAGSAPGTIIKATFIKNENY